MTFFGRVPIRLTVIVVCLWSGMHTGSIGAEPLWQEDEQRLGVGLKVFAAVLGAQEALADKRSPDGNLEVVVVCEGSAESARQAASDLQGIGPIRGLPLRVTTLTTAALDEYAGPPIGGIFVANVGVSAQRLRTWSERYGTLVFSPFSGDVEAGAVAGIYVADQILPYINIGQAKRAGVRFKPFLLKVARKHD